MYIIIIFIIIICFSILILISKSFGPDQTAANSDTSNDFMNKCDMIASSDLDSPSTIESNIHKLDRLYEKKKPYLTKGAEEYYREARKELEEDAQNAVFDEWEEKASRYIDNFFDEYESIVSDNEDGIDFAYVEVIADSKKKCIKNWKNYFALDITALPSSFDLLKYFQECLGDNYNPCMSTLSSLETKLDQHTVGLDQMLKRKQSLCKKIVAFVATRGEYARVDLLREPFEGFTPDEVKYGYKRVYSQGKLIEFKVGGRIRVKLPDSSTAR